MFDYWLTSMKMILSVFTYHLHMPVKPLQNEIALVSCKKTKHQNEIKIFFPSQIIGSDSILGRAFATQMTKMNGTVVCLDTEKDKGDAFVKEINSKFTDTKAFFYECDVRNKESLAAVIEKITKEIGDISILLNCSRTDVVATYFDVS